MVNLGTRKNLKRFQKVKFIIFHFDFYHIEPWGSHSRRDEVREKHDCECTDTYEYVLATSIKISHVKKLNQIGYKRETIYVPSITYVSFKFIHQQRVALRRHAIHQPVRSQRSEVKSEVTAQQRTPSRVGE